MAKIKHTKNELKAQKDSLSRFERFLPMLQLKKQQLQAEIQSIDARINERRARLEQRFEELSRWVKLFAEPVETSGLVVLQEIETDEGNIAGVNIPLFVDLKTRKEEVDLFETPAWLDDAQDAIQELMELRIETEILEEQKRLVAEELRTTSQRVNLFEKVKIPECKENIRVIKIFLGDEQTAAVARGKLAKKRTQT